MDRTIRLLAILLLAMASGSHVTAAERPNVLLILPDQMRASAMGCMGNDQVLTPHIDKLAREGILFRHMIANTPVCCPARAILLTGKYPHKNGMIANDLRLRESEVTLAELLAAEGYRTGFVGKWHLDGGLRDPGFVPPGPRRQGFEFWAAYECHHQHFRPTYFRDTPEPIVISKFEPEASCDFAVEFLKSQPREKPFFLTVQMGPPHDPYGAPAEYMDKYDIEKLKPPKNWVSGSEEGPMEMPQRRPAPGDPDIPRLPAGTKAEIAAYYAAITALDDQVGRLMQTLKESGLDENTIVLFTSDHGDMLNSHGMRRKRKPHEESANVPGIVRWPKGTPAGKTVDTLFSHVDIAPTVLSLCELKPSADMQGTDLSRVVRGETIDGPEAAFMQIFVPFAGDKIHKGWRGLRTARYTYARHEDAAWVLFDNESDPFQMNNLADDPDSKELQGNLDTQLAALMKKHGDAWTENYNLPVEEGGRLYRSRAFYSIPEYLEWEKGQAP